MSISQTQLALMLLAVGIFMQTTANFWAFLMTYGHAAHATSFPYLPAMRQIFQMTWELIKMAAPAHRLMGGRI